MDPLTVIGLVGNILTFIDFANKLLKSVGEIHDSASGLSEGDRTLRQVTRDLQRFSHGLKHDEKSSGYDPKTGALGDLAADCEDVADELLETLDQVQAKNPASKRESVKVALKRLWKAKDIESLQRRLGVLSNALDRQVQGSFRTDVLAQLTQIVESGNSQKLDISQLQRSIDEMRASLDVATLDSDALRHFKSMVTLSGDALILKRQQIILDALKFDDRNERYRNVVPAHVQTLEWIFEEEAAKVESDWLQVRPQNYERDEAHRSLCRWLEQDVALFHILGKPGSGKSTLMKFLYEHERMKAMLQAWAGDKRLIMAEFFFWKPGTRLQSSLEGLCHGLLYSILRDCPELMQMLFPYHWKQTQTTICGGPGLQMTAEDISTAFNVLTTSLEVSQKYRLVFFIDGLDEFKPDSHHSTYSDLVKLLKQWTSGPFQVLKICLSSRELPIFEETFADSPRLKVQDLTAGDIQNVVDDFLSQNEAVAKLELSTDQTEILRSNLIVKSDGVFLWLTLVLQNLEEGILNGDAYKDVLARLLVLPTELHDLFNSIFESIPRHDQQYCLPLLRILCEASEGQYGIAVLDFWAVDMDLRKDWLPLWTDKDFLDTIPKNEIESHFFNESKKLCRRIQGRFKGLLVAPHIETAEYYNTPIQFTHRSIQEFLRDKQRDTEAENPFNQFDWLKALCEALLASTKLSLRTGLGLPRQEPVQEPLTISQIRRHLSEHWYNRMAGLVRFVISKHGYLSSDFVHTLNSIETILFENRALSTTWQPETCSQRRAFFMDPRFLLIKCTCQVVLHFDMDLCMAYANAAEYFEAKYPNDEISMRNMPPELFGAALLGLGHDENHLARVLLTLRTLFSRGMDPNCLLSFANHDDDWDVDTKSVVDSHENKELIYVPLLEHVISRMATHDLYFDKTADILQSLIEAGADARIWYLFPQGMDVDKKAPPSPIRQRQGSSDEKADIWRYSAVIYSELLMTILLSRISQPLRVAGEIITLADFVTPDRFRLSAEVWEVIEAAKVEVHREIDLHGFQIPDGLLQSELLAVYPTHPHRKLAKVSESLTQFLPQEVDKQ